MKYKIITFIIMTGVVFGFGLMPAVEVKGIGHEMAKHGVIDVDRFVSMYKHDTELYRQAIGLFEPNSEIPEMNEKNSQMLLNFYWGFGLGNKNEILTHEMMQYGNTANFASTGGWILAKGNAMNHYNMHQIIELDDTEQKLVDEVTRNIYRPCCNNSAHFPDCNHGMAMLGYMEYLADRGLDETQLYEKALEANLFWFPSLGQISCSV